MVSIRKNLVDPNKYSIKCPYSMTPQFIVVHNTANDASAENEINYMKNNNNEVSFHIAVDDKEAVQGIEFNRNAWHAGDGVNGNGNRNGIAIEICYSKSGGDRFNKAEQNAIELIADLLKEYGWGTDKVKKHNDFCNTSCPHRTKEHWAEFINAINSKLGNNNNSINNKKSNEELADEVIAQKWGNGVERKNRLTNAGYDYNAIQNIVNNKLLGTNKKTIDQLADEVIAQKWGNGEERKNRLTAAGYDYNAVQNRVNEILK